MNDDHIPAPVKHKPDVLTYQSGQIGMTIQEQDNPIGWVYSDTVVEVKR